ncbi:TetR family transcriptional regulator [Nocardia sp. SYP-A9097]|uniref:TetR/AcrR family transcriptional regulator n=1 Tax=Nocardia sp. SYP-A9097 TaxID=2663237 RepID=UPI00129B3755|nr:TetR/AcrR family transcriptional regulator [Nocardia sp. SYP-A9097]MRH88345.1 TetR family transcriptional regulator [Nocardia sp. SYP-A9097]
MTEVPARRRGRPPAAESNPGQTRERIVRAALELFAEKGFHATSVGEIGDRAGIQRGALYYHIGSKEELLFEIRRNYTQLMLEAAARIAESDDAPMDKLRSLIRSHVRLILEHRHEVTIALRDAGALSGERARDLQELRDGIQRSWQRVFDEGYAAAVLNTADHVVTNSVVAMLNMVSAWYHPEGEHSPDRIADILTTTILGGVATPAAITPKG